MSRWLFSVGPLMLAVGQQQPVHAADVDLAKFKRIEPQYIAALGAPGATSGNVGNHGAFGARTRARAVAIWIATLN